MLHCLERGTVVPSVAELAKRVGWSERRLRDVFRCEVGLTPKQFARVERFQRVLREVEQGQMVDWAELALAHGYYDQAHLIGEFRACSGLTPTAYQRQRVAPGNHVPLP